MYDPVYQNDPDGPRVPHASGGNLIANLFGGEFQTYNTNLARLLGGIPEAIILQYLSRWQGRADDGWAYRTEEQVETDTCIHARQFRNVRNRLTAMGILEQRRSGVPARNYYRVDGVALAVLLTETEPPRLMREPEPGDDPSQICPTAELDLPKGHNLSYRKSITSPTERAPLLTETKTQEEQEIMFSARAQEHAFRAYAEGVGLSETSPRYKREWAAAAADISAMQANGTLPEPDVVRTMGRYAVRSLTSSGITSKPSFTKVVIDRWDEFEEWRRAWEAAGSPLVAGEPDYLLLRHRSNTSATVGGNGRVDRHAQAEELKRRLGGQA